MLLGDRYRLERRLAAGGMGEVWSADDVVLGRQVAVKVLHAELTEVPGFLERFRREARNLAMLSHPSIATLFDYGEQDGSPYLIMELVTGQTLARRLASGRPMSIDEVVDVLSQVAIGLAVAHEAGLVHRDIKPANVMITDRGKVKITDFGISRLVDSAALTAAGDVLGTPQYMSPEQITGAPASPSSDVYSLGVLAYEMLTGSPPFTADSPVAVALAQLHDLPPPLPATVPRRLADLVGRSLAKDPAARPANGGEVAAALGGHDPVPREGTGAPANTAMMPSTAMMTSADVETIVVTPRGISSGALLGSMSRHRTKRRVSLAFAVGAVVALGWAIVVGGPDDGTGLNADTASTPGPTASTATTPVASAVAITALAPTSDVTTTSVGVIDPAEFVGRNHTQVVEELRALGYTVTERRVEAERGTKKDTVVAIEPSGPVPAGATIEVQVAKPVKGKP